MADRVKIGEYDAQGILHTLVFVDTFESRDEKDAFIAEHLDGGGYYMSLQKGD